MSPYVKFRLKNETINFVGYLCSKSRSNKLQNERYTNDESFEKGIAKKTRFSLNVRVHLIIKHFSEHDLSNIEREN
jgi:hypothetical protein